MPRVQLRSKKAALTASGERLRAGQERILGDEGSPSSCVGNNLKMGQLTRKPFVSLTEQAAGGRR